MGDNGGEEENLALTESGVTSFSQLLLSDGVIEDVTVDRHRDEEDGDGGKDGFCFGFSTKGGPTMLCFGGAHQNDAELLFAEPSVSSRVTSLGGSSSPVSSCNNNKNKNTTCTPQKSSRSNKKKRNGSGDDDQDRVQSVRPVLGSSECCQRTRKKSKTDQKSPPASTKARKERLGERITTLQQLVSPYGKTDTASVLHEAMGYIKFLQEQVQVLCSPYLLHHPHHPPDDGEVGDLRSRGLCLVPVSCTVGVANTNGADFWSPAMGQSMSMNQ